MNEYSKININETYRSYLMNLQRVQMTLLLQFSRNFDFSM
jgi:hypothetical protein